MPDFFSKKHSIGFTPFAFGSSATSTCRRALSWSCVFAISYTLYVDSPNTPADKPLDEPTPASPTNPETHGILRA
eukprot:1195960-Prorocentrum_minimum.AAC.4